MKTKILEKNDFDEIINILNSEGTIALATDTVFGLACLFDSEKGVNSIYEAKHRPSNKALPLMCNKKMLKDYVKYDQKYQKLIDKFMPGALTIVCRHKINNSIVDLDTVAVRIPDDELIIKIIEKIQKPLWVTSANISGEKSLMNYEDVYDSLNGKIDAIVKDKSKGDIPSTIISLVDEFKILRKGKIEESELRKYL